MCALSALIYEDVLKRLESAIAFAILANNNINITIIKPVLVSCEVLQYQFLYYQCGKLSKAL